MLGCERGSALVETALATPIWFACVFGVMWGSLLMYAAHSTATAASAAARYAIVRGSTWIGTPCQSTASANCDATAANVQSYVEGILPPGLSADSLTVSTQWPGTTATGSACDTDLGTNGPGCMVTVGVTYSFKFSIPLVPKASIPVSATSTMMVLQ